MSKRDDDGTSDMDVGMTTAERRRRRRRGTGLRVPSDNVPRSRTPSAAPPAPVPEDPALAMSIAYSFSNDASGPVQRPTGEHLPMAPESMPTVIDPPSAPVEQQDFEMNTREMSAVDLEALGLSSEANATTPFQRGSAPRLDRAEVEVDVSVDEPVPLTRPKMQSQAIAPLAVPGNRHRTVALSEEDLEEVRAATDRAQTQPARAQTSPPVPAAQPRRPATVPPPITAAQTKKPTEANKTMQLSAVDVEVIASSANSKTAGEEPVSVSDIDIQDLADRAEQSGEIEVDVDAEEPPPAMSRAASRQSVPPPTPEKQAASPAPSERPSGPGAKSNVVDGQHAATAHPAPAGAVQAITPTPSGAHHAPPPPPPAGAAAHKPPTPPPAAAPKKPVPQAAVAAVIAKEPSRPNTSKQRQWFVDLFDEDYLRTLPFLTPQATQAEAEFVINAMNLAPGANVLDLGCGYGRHAMELAARGFHVVGLDLSTPLLVRGGEEAHRRGLTINFVRGDMRELDFEQQFDAAYCLFSTFGYFDDETNKKTLQNISRALKPGGKFLVEILNRDYIIADLPTRVWWEGDGCVVLEEVELNYFSSRIQVNRSVVFDDGRQLEQEISVRAYSLHEVGKLMHAAGFRVLEVSGGYQMKGRFLGNQSRHIIVLAERKETSGS
jgi:SAM-dependent methyltransferase